MKLEGKVAIITGAAQGIGRAYAKRFASEGAAVGIVDIRQEQAKAVEREIMDEGGQALAVRGDVTIQDSIEAAVRAVTERFGDRVDILINNAAIWYDYDMGDQSIEYCQKVLDVNLFGFVRATNAVFPYMKRQRSGSIINITSISAYPLPARRAPEIESVGIPAYELSKSAVIHLTKSWARALGLYGIRVNAIAPGVTMTEATQKMMSRKWLEALTSYTALKTMLEPSDLTGVALFLASDDSALMTGQTLVVDAGLILLG